MQQMEQGESGNRAHSLYEGYEGEISDPWNRPRGQKLESDDEQFASILARKIRQDMSNESANSGKSVGARERMVLAVNSVWVAAIIFALLIFALLLKLQGSAIDVLIGGTVAAFAAIVFVNGFFNWASIESAKKNQEKLERDVEDKNLR